MIRYKNPIIPGFYPDPSICRDGEDYYLVNSSFEYFPGIPLFHSKDLIHWEQIGHVLTRESQICLKQCRASGGIWAPTIRLHNNRFYVSVTNFDHGGNFVVWTDDIYGEWSDPVRIDQGGIDPSLFFDEDGSVYFTSTYDMPDAQGIGQCMIDIETGKKLTETRVIWMGSGGKYPEGPHMFKRNGWYYLLAAEGGTEYGHMVTICRGKSPWGPFENCPFNPILTHRNTMLHHFQAIGHGDMINTDTDDSWIVFHGIRTTQYMLHHLGRETMLAPVDWQEDGWPIVNYGRNILPDMEADRRQKEEWQADEEDIDPFAVPVLPMTWNYLRNPDTGLYSLTERPGYLRVKGCELSLNDCASPAFVGRRQQHFCMRAEVRIECNPQDETQLSGITVFHTNEHHYDLIITKKEGEKVAALRKRVGDMETITGYIKIREEESIMLRIESDKLEYRFYAGNDETDLQQVGTGRTQLLSTECMPMTFTGCYIGLFAEGEITAWFREFRYFVL